MLVACGESSEFTPNDVDMPERTPTVQQQPEEAPEPIMTIDQMREEVRADLIADLEYLEGEFEANMPLYGVILRKLGINLTEHFANMREHIAKVEFGKNAETFEEMKRAGADFLYWYLSIEIEQKLRSTGHLSLIPRDMYSFYLYIYTDTMRELEGTDAHLANLRGNFEAFSNPAAMWFYNFDESELDSQDLTHRERVNDSSAIRTRRQEEEKIAWLTINHATNELDFDRETLLPFFEEIQDYHHLVIDLRGHRGGLCGHFIEVVMKPLLSAPVFTRHHHFFMNGERVQRQVEDFMLFLEKTTTGEFPGISIDIADKYIQANDMTEFNLSDLETLTYVVSESDEVIPLENGFPFNGKIWILTGPNTASAGEMAAMAAISSGFATVVGAPTMGVTPTGSIIGSETVLLPYSGIILRMDINYYTDSLGRSIDEFGVTPDIPNRPGLNAEQTVLELITEGAY